MTLRPVAAALLLVAGALAGCTTSEPDSSGAVRDPPAATGGPVGGTVIGGSPTTPGGVSPTVPTGTSPTPSTPPLPANVVVIAFSADKGRVEPGERLLATATLRNEGGMSGAGTLTLLVDGEPIAAGEFEVPAGATAVESFALTLSDMGDHLVSLLASGATVDVGPIDVEVVQAGAFSLSGLTALPPAIELGDLTRVTLTVTNTGGTRGTGDVRLAVGGETLGVQPVDLDPGASKELAFTVTPTKGGVLPVRATVSSGSAETLGNLTVRAPQVANAGGEYRSGFCLSYLEHTVVFDNTGDGIMRDVKVLAVVLLPNGTEHSRQEMSLGNVLAGAHAEVAMTPSATNRCGQDDVYSMRFTITPKFGEAVTFERGPFTI